MADKDERCGNCLYGKIRKGEVTQVDCFRYPCMSFPLIVPNALGQLEIKFVQSAPVMPSADWCGEYKPKKSVLI